MELFLEQRASEWTPRDRALRSRRTHKVASSNPSAHTATGAFGHHGTNEAISGSTRATSTNMAALRTMWSVAPEGVTTVLYEGLSELPAFNPEDDGECSHPAVAALRQ